MRKRYSITNLIHFIVYITKFTCAPCWSSCMIPMVIPPFSFLYIACWHQNGFRIIQHEQMSKAINNEL